MRNVDKLYLQVLVSLQIVTPRIVTQTQIVTPFLASQNVTIWVREG